MYLGICVQEAKGGGGEFLRVMLKAIMTIHLIICWWDILNSDECCPFVNHAFEVPVYSTTIQKEVKFIEGKSYCDKMFHFPHDPISINGLILVLLNHSLLQYIVSNGSGVNKESFTKLFLLNDN